MKSEIIHFILGYLLDVNSEYLSGLPLCVDGIDDDNFPGPVFIKDKIKKNLSYACSNVEDRNVLGKRAPPQKAVCHIRPESVISEKNVTASENDDVFVHSPQRLHRG